MMTKKPSVQNAAAAAQLVSIDTPASGDGVPLVFCASGTYDSSVTYVIVELIDDSGGVYNFRSAMSGGNWSSTIRLPSNDPAVLYELRAYYLAGDGSSCVSLTYDSTLLDKPGIEAGSATRSEVVSDEENGRSTVAAARPTLAERLAALAKDLPQEVLDRMPSDGASQHDHYLYGTPKRTDLS